MVLTVKGTGKLAKALAWVLSLRQRCGGALLGAGWAGVGVGWGRGLLGLAALLAPAGPPAWVVEAKAGEGICSDSACICIWFTFACQS